MAYTRAPHGDRLNSACSWSALLTPFYRAAGRQAERSLPGDRSRSARPRRGGGAFTLDRAVESVRAVIAEAGGRAHLVGISGGATVALLTYLENPGRVASPVLSAGVAHAPRLVSLQRAIQRAIPEPMLARLLRGWYRAAASTSRSQPRTSAAVESRPSSLR